MNKSDLNAFNRLVELLLEEEIQNPAVAAIPVEDLFNRLDLKLEDQPLEDQKLYELLEVLIQHSPKTASTRFFNQLIGGRRSKAVLGDVLASVLNNSMYTYKVAGPMVGVEKSVIQSVSQLIGYSANSGGTITSGGSMSNFMGMVLARDHKLNSSINEGVQQKMILYTSAEAHYSIAKNASLMGIGKHQIRAVPTDHLGSILAHKLIEAIEKDKKANHIPFMVNATAGTTVLGAFDDIDAIADVCDEYKLWLHVDGAYGGAAAFTAKRSHYLKGVERSDSFSVSAHKMLGTPLTCSIFVTQHQAQLFQSFSSEADYLFQTQTDEYNLGKSSLQCGRRNDALKLWTLWKSIGTKGLGELVDHQFNLATTAKEYVKNHPDYTLYGPENSTSVCFNYKNIDPELLSKRLHEHQQLLVSYGSFNEQKFIRLVTINSDNGNKEIIDFFHILENFVQQNPNLFK